MWTRGELKRRAKAALQSYYGAGILVCIIAGILGSGGGGSGSFRRVENQFSSYQYDPELFSMLLAFFFIMLAVGVALSVFIGNVIIVGKLKFFIDSRNAGQSCGIGTLFFGFRSGHYLNILKIMFLKGLYEFLWSLLLIIPGIYKAYEYYMIPYLLAENPGIDCREAFRLSEEIMNGNRFDTWVLELSFTGWYILGSLACLVGILFVNPYYEATLVELYLHMKDAMGLNPQPPVDTVYNDYYNTF